MKKFFITLVLLTSFTSVFAVETKFDGLGLHFSIPMTFEYAENNGIKATSDMFAIGFGLDGLSLFSDKIGLFCSGDFFFPKKMNLRLSYAGSTYSASVSSADFNSIYGMSTLIGPAIVITKTENMLLFVSPGVHYIMLNTSINSSSESSYMFGVGADIQDLIYFAKYGYFSFGLTATLDFFGFTSSYGSSSSGKTIDFSLIPAIGIGMKF